jgi:GNAT superfamily N-acetyltransferase
MHPNIRQYDRADEELVVQLSLRAWAPVFASMKRVLGAELFEVIWSNDWREDQAKDVRDVLVDSSNSVWVAALAAVPIGFVAAALNPDELVGTIVMLAVDPDHQRRGVGSALTQHATDWLRGSGMRLAIVEAGGDPGHAPARRTYERAKYTQLPIARYFQAL